MRQLQVRSIEQPTYGIKLFELVAPSGERLLPFTAGAHVHITAPGGIARPYSLCGDPADRDRYVVAVLREPQGRGGSKALHDKVAVGHLLEVSEPRNDFALDLSEDRHCILIAGGIGATPLIAMAHQLHSEGRSFEVHYGARSTERLIFRDRLQALVAPERLHLYAGDGNVTRRMNAEIILQNADPTSIVYCCGPSSLLAAVKSACAAAPGVDLHFEQFKIETPQDASAFEVELARSGKRVPVRDNESILVALWRAGCARPFSCEVGICGACRTRYLAGDPEHRDSMLSAEERERELLICVSRSRSARLTLDI